MSRVLNKNHVVTYNYKKGIHDGIDLVGEGYTLADVIAHSRGTVVAIRNDYKTTDKTGNSYGNYVKIKHEDGYETLYAHLKFGSVCVKVGDIVDRGQKIGFMGATGYCFGAHTHFEIRKDGVRIDPTQFINSDLPIIKKNEEKKNIDEIAKEVISGKWGNGDERKNRLSNAGYNYNEVQSRVNQMLGTNNSNKKSIDEIARLVIQGKYGNQPERQKKLEAEGYNYREVQNRVNQILKG